MKPFSQLTLLKHCHHVIICSFGMSGVTDQANLMKEEDDPVYQFLPCFQPCRLVFLFPWTKTALYATAQSLPPENKAVLYGLDCSVSFLNGCVLVCINHVDFPVYKLIKQVVSSSFIHALSGLYLYTSLSLSNRSYEPWEQKAGWMRTQKICAIIYYIKEILPTSWEKRRTDSRTLTVRG